MNTLNTLNIILGLQLTMGLPEIIICELGALVLGFTIHFVWNSKKNLHVDEPSQATGISENDNWKLKYYNDMDMQERAQQQLRERLAETKENEQILTIELEEARKELELALGYNKSHPAALKNMELVSRLDGNAATVPMKQNETRWDRWKAGFVRLFVGPLEDQRTPSAGTREER